MGLYIHELYFDTTLSYHVLNDISSFNLLLYPPGILWFCVRSAAAAAAAAEIFLSGLYRAHSLTDSFYILRAYVGTQDLAAHRFSPS